MATYTVMADDRRVDDGMSEEVLVGSLHLNELELGSWGASWQPDAPADRFRLDVEPHPPDEERWASSNRRDNRPRFERHDAYGEDVLRLRRLIIGR